MTNACGSNPGAETLVKTMAANGVRCVLVSGGFSFFTSRVAKLAGFHEDRANRLLDDGATLTGDVARPILEREAKPAALREAVKLGATPDDALAIGDGANDLDMIKAAGLGIAYRAEADRGGGGAREDRAHLARQRATSFKAIAARSLPRETTGHHRPRDRAFRLPQRPGRCAHAAADRGRPRTPAGNRVEALTQHGDRFCTADGKWCANAAGESPGPPIALACA